MVDCANQVAKTFVLKLLGAGVLSRCEVSGLAVLEREITDRDRVVVERGVAALLPDGLGCQGDNETDARDVVGGTKRGDKALVVALAIAWGVDGDVVALVVLY